MDFNEQLNFMVKMAGSAMCFENIQNVKTENLHFEALSPETVAIVGQTCRYVLPFNFETCLAVSKRLANIKPKQQKKHNTVVAKKLLKKAEKTPQNNTNKKDIEPKNIDITERLRLSKLYINRQIV